MTITLQLDPEFEYSVETAAKKAGLTVEQYILDTVRSVAEAANETQPEHSLLELRGLGAGLWIDAMAGTTSQEYVDTLRSEWDERP